MPFRSSSRHLQTVITLVLSVLLIAAGWTGTVATPWWPEPTSPWWHLLPLGAMIGPLLWKHRAPVAALAVAAPIVAADVAIGGSVGIWLCVADLIYQVGLRAAPRAVRGAAGAFGAAAVAAIVFAATDSGWRSALSLGVTSFAILLLPLWWSSEVRRGYPLWPQRYARRALEEERNAALLRLHEREQSDAIEAERRELARELHDTVSSQVSAVALTAGGALAGPADSDRDRASLESIRRLSVDALNDLRAMVALLRGADAIEGASDLLSGQRTTWADVVSRAQAQGLEVVPPEPPADDLLDALAPATRGVLLRSLGEVLHNAAKHGDGAARLSLDRGRSMIRLRATNHPRASDRERPDRGHGITGMRERVRAVGGRMSAGVEERQDGAPVWCVDIELPAEEAA